MSRVQGSGFRVQGPGFRVQGRPSYQRRRNVGGWGFGLRALGLRVWGFRLRLRVEVSGFRVDRQSRWLTLA